MHLMLQSLCDHDAVSLVDEAGFDAFLAAGPDRLTTIFFAGDPDKKLETADVVVVLRELLGLYPDQLRVGLVASDAESALMEKTANFAIPALVFYAGPQRLEVIPKIQDWSVYAEALPRLLGQITSEVTA